MAQAQAQTAHGGSELERAIFRAAQADTRVMATGKRVMDGAPLYLTTGSVPGQWHAVAVLPDGTLACDHPHRAGTWCVHRAAVWTYRRREASDARIAAETARMHDAAARLARTLASAPTPAPAPAPAQKAGKSRTGLLDNTRAFSIFK